MTDLTPIAPKLARLIPRLATEADGEIIATVRAIRRTLSGVGADLHDLTRNLVALPPPPDTATKAQRPSHAEMILWLMRNRLFDLTDREHDFIANIASRRSRFGVSRLSEKQATWLEAIYDRQTGGRT